jgi:hypothetical protein
MSWLDASEYLSMEQAVRDRIDDARRFSTEHAFHPETSRAEGSACASRAPVVCAPLVVRPPWTARESSSAH